MTNTEFLSMLDITGRVNIQELENKSGMQQVINDIRNNERFIGKIYLKLLDIDKMNEILAFKVVNNLVLRHNLSDSETDIVIGRLTYIKQYLEIGYIKQLVLLDIELKRMNKNKDREEELYNCNVSEDKKIIYIGRKIGLHRLILKDDKIEAYSFFEHKVVCNDVKYIIMEDSGIIIVGNKDYNSEIKNRDRNKYKIIYKLKE